MDTSSGFKGICNNGVDCSFHSYANKTNFHMKNFAISLTFIVSQQTQKWHFQTI